MFLVIGHKNPDTDSVVSAMVYADFQNKKRGKYLPAVAGKINNESSFALNFLKIKAPKQVNCVSGKDTVILVDHCEIGQAVEGMEKAKIAEIIDHHKLGGLITSGPIKYRSEPVGSTSAMIYKIFKEGKIKPTKKQASLLLFGIISDTLNLTSPTTTETDKTALKELSKLSGLNTKKLADKMFKAKSDISKMQLEDILNADHKIFKTPKGEFGFGVWETTNVDVFLDKKQKIVDLILKQKEEKEVVLNFFAIIDIVKQKSILHLASDKEENVAVRAFKKTIKEKEMVLDKVVSRKKQMIPQIIKTLLSEFPE